VLSRDDADKSQGGVFQAEARILTVDRSIDNQWLVAGGLEEGELVVIEGLMKIQAGKPVKGVPGDEGKQAVDASPAGAAAPSGKAD
jgi:membrane fusion protein (multidrug efflux system)